MAALLLCGALAACNDKPSPKAAPSTDDPLTPIALPTLRPQEFRSSADPRTLLSPTLRDDLMRNADPKETSCRHTPGKVADTWQCTVVTLYPGGRSRDLTFIDLTVHLPFVTQDATARAADEFTSGVKNMDPPGPLPSQLKSPVLGDQAYRSEPDRDELRAAWVIFRRQNVVASVRVSEFRRGAGGPEPATYADQLKRALQLATELSRAVPRLPRQSSP
ncbi:hypothetical protein [Actinomadura rupiterrae]|uniref:hypothetical protein n=1 Tax=Actinomadura rupiterrae TaxID=559627 RepID=UPI0020A36300|nr:hypothetical protein [Actinomadura rupiterrae]MCP2338974.1 hypothetical protein [Actinomadura rupiterrae]